MAPEQPCHDFNIFLHKVATNEAKNIYKPHLLQKPCIRCVPRHKAMFGHEPNIPFKIRVKKRFKCENIAARSYRVQTGDISLVTQISTIEMVDSG